jgi:hypothetical protein
LITYDVTKTSLSKEDIKTLVLSRITDFNNNTVTGFDKTLRYSKLVQEINEAHSSIVANDTQLLLFKLYTPDLDNPVSVSIDFNNEILKTSTTDKFGNPSFSENNLFSSTFNFGGKICRFQDNDGNLDIVTETDSGTLPVRTAIGTVDYTTGRVTLNAISFDEAPGAAIKIYVRTAYKDIEVFKNSYLTIDQTASSYEVRTASR